MDENQPAEDQTSSEKTRSANTKETLKSVLLWIGGFFAVGASVAGFFADGISTIKEFTEEEVSGEVLGLQAKLNGLLEGQGDVAVPAECMPSDEAVLRPMVDAALLLAGGKAQSKRPQDAEALANLSAQVDQNPQNTVFWALLAKAYLFNDGDIIEVVKNAKIAAGQCGQWAYPQNLIGNANLINEQFVDAEVAYRSALAKSGDYAAPRFNIALISLKQKKYDVAVQQLDELLKKHAHHTNGHLLRAQANLGLGELAKAAEDVQRALQKEQNNANAYVLYGQILKKQDNDEEARVALCRARALGHPAGKTLCPDGAEN